MDFNITREEVLELAANKVADQMADYEETQGLVNKLIRERVEQAFKESLTKRVDALLNETVLKLVDETVTPVDIWGERTGLPTTIRQALAQRAKDFWLVKVNADGKEATYNGTERWKMFLQQVSKEEFTKAIQENIECIVTGVREALRADTGKLLGEHIEKLIPSKRR